ncbi:metalloregulator ArsR/SmtB family transcription factor [Marichromatium bheemlicum]|uniref:Metalloregulator ArsR/SmtB family transcription factor n=1 Tax=Marichromatium bheemlicum TaxID=365339 RepID=A0ABX1IDG2_9GAMM|nr:metalloregulator ArsR/SmtB family transcription factor [Marichromatium bheemlicum]NKN34215.1 metalloregulator ArsR/SmtB family transcription factor [Marichromatium bheemlicum]
MNLKPTDLFAALSNDTRLRCVVLLLEQGELCVCELTHATGSAQPHVSRHLAQLRELGLVADRRAGLWVYYRVHPALPDWARRVLNETLAGVRGQAPFSTDAANLASMPGRPSAPRCA